MEEIYLKEFEKLNSYQKEAVISKGGHILLNAVVGSGKTTVLTHKVLYLNIIEKIPLEDMVVLTFTNKAAEEIKERVLAFRENFKEGMKYFGTFHSIARAILSESSSLEALGYSRDFEVIDNVKAGDMLLEIIESNKLKVKYKSKLMKRIEEFKKGNTLYGAMKKDDDISRLAELYNEEKRRRNLMDFDDLIEKCIEALREPINPKWIIIDEFQDTDLRQLELIGKIAGRDTSIFAVGDPNQIIYSWRTGTTNIFSEFKKVYNPREMSLPVNYRSSRTIIGAAKALLGGEDIKGVKDGGSPIIVKKHHDAFNEALHIARRIKNFHGEGIPYKDIGILYRRQSQGEVLSEVFEKEGIPFKIVYKKGIPFEEEGEFDRESVSLLTIHASKGLEFSHVFITGVNMGNIPLSTKRDQEEEEVRIFFVGITRAKNYLELSYITKPSLPGMLPYPSTYISMIPSSMVKRDDEGEGTSLKDIMKLLREEREKKQQGVSQRRAKHPKYGEGIITYEDDSIIKVEFEGYGEKEFSKLFCPLVM